MLHDAVTKSAIVWCLQAATRIHSNRAAADCVSLFPLMFPDSEIAQKMQLHRDKIGYLVTYGLALFLRKQLLDTFAVATVTDLRLGIKNAIGDDLERKLLQISMYGPTVNFKMLKDYQQELKEDHGGTSMVDLGSCGLHVVHGAFKTGVNAVQWDLKEFLIGLHYLFHKSPARRGHFTKTTASEVFPIPFCFTRWVENAKAGTRAIAMLPHLKTWVDEVRREGKANILNKGHKNFDRVARALKDKLLGPKLAFFVSTAEMIEPFLTEFQSNNPMAPLLYREIESLTVALMERVVLKHVLQKETKVINVSLKEANLIDAKDFDLGFATKAAIRDANKARQQKIPDHDLLQFRKDYVMFVKMVEKVQERSPLKYKMTRAISCLDPVVVSETPSLAEDRVLLALEILSTQKNWLSGAKADRIKRSYSALLRLPSVVARLKEFDGKEPRLDSLWLDLVVSAPSSVLDRSDLMHFVKMRSFSLNNDCVIVNQKETSRIANRIVRDAVVAAGGVDKITTSKALILSARNSHSLYKEAKEARSKKEKEEAAKVAEKRQSNKRNRRA
ncbi:hypothetical protein FOCC_FOCC016927 [Frankliniella occidentalis]|nr:hypothetical protein FOCC_FOCC016927 [Frankliniella occidentalis]